MIAGTASARARIERTLLRFAGRAPPCRLSACLVGGALAVQPALAAAQAGTHISNTATLSAGPVGERYTLNSNTAVLTADEMLDVAIAAKTPTLAVIGTTAQVAVPFIVTNRGNGNEPIRIVATLAGSGATITGIAVDANNNGVYDADTDSLVDPAGLPTTAGQVRLVFILVAAPTMFSADIGVTAIATVATGSGAPGAVFAGRGDAGGDAVVGRSGGIAQASTTLRQGMGMPTLVKSQSVLASDGSMRAFHGSVVTYTLLANFPGATPAVEVMDAIPDGTRYIAGSLTLDDQPLSDGADGDIGSFDGSAVHVALGDMAAAAVRTIRFKTIIQ